jgi:fucose 4-O-acetylase-like acetyltransferase
MGTATMVIYLFHGFVIKTFKAIGWPEFTTTYPVLGLVLTILGAVGLALLLASPPVRRVLEPFTNPLGWLEERRARRAESREADRSTPAPTSD